MQSIAICLFLSLGFFVASPAGGDDHGAQSKPASAPASDSATLTAREREKAVKLMHESEKQMLAAVESLSDAQWTFKPAPDKWSVGEVVEHLAIVEERVSGALTKALGEKADADWKTKKVADTEMLEKMLVNRDNKVKAPEAVAPSGKLSKADALKRYKAARAASLAIAEKADTEFKAHFMDHPFFGTLNAYQWMLITPLHNMRHNQQIAEVKGNAEFPKK